MKLFVDDFRKRPSGWSLARTNTKAIRVLRSGNVTAISLDHDIFHKNCKGNYVESGETFMPVAFYLSVMPRHLVPDVYLHSSNPVGAEQMRRILTDVGIHIHYSPSPEFK